MDVLSDLVQGVKLSESWDDLFDLLTEEELEKIDRLADEYYLTKDKKQDDNEVDLLSDLVQGVSLSDDFSSPPFTPPMKKEYERSTMNSEEQFAACLNELLRKRFKAEKDMMRRYVEQERQWRILEAKKPTGVSQQFLWNETRKERERVKGVKLEASKTLYEFVSSTIN